MAQILFPWAYVPDPKSGRPIALGTMFFGQPDTDPTVLANQVQVRGKQEDGTLINLSQPIDTNAGGVPTFDGSPIILDIVEGEFSLLVRNSSGAQVYFNENNIPLEITSEQIADGAITTPKLADGAVTTIKIDNLAVTEAKLGDLSVSTAKIQLLAVTEAQLGDLSVATGKLQDGASTNAKLADMAQATIKGRADGAGTGVPVDLSGSQVLPIIGLTGTIADLDVDAVISLSGDSLRIDSAEVTPVLFSTSTTVIFNTAFDTIPIVQLTGLAGFNPNLSDSVTKTQFTFTHVSAGASDRANYTATGKAV